MINPAYTFDDIQIVPRFSEIKSRLDVSLSTQFTRRYRIDIPIISSPMDTVTEHEMVNELNSFGATGIIHRFMSIENQCRQLKSINALKSAAIGATGDFKERAQELQNAGVEVLLIDVAHGNTSLVRDAIWWCKLNLRVDIDIIAGNVATKAGAYNLALWGADAIRVGIGNGAVCSTRINTGVGVPQVTAIMDCIQGMHDASRGSIPIIADGGIRSSGDVAKALSLGADSVMLGSLLAGTKESPGNIERIGKWPNEQLFKKYRGSASMETKMEHGLAAKNVEGVSAIIPYKGGVVRVLTGICEGVQSAMSYVGASNIDEFGGYSNHVLVTNAGIVEAQPHLLL